MVKDVSPAGTMAVSSPSRSMSWKILSQATACRAGHRPEENALLTIGPMVPLLVRCPRCAVNPNIPASCATTSFSMRAVAGPTSRAGLLGLTSMALTYPITAAGCGGLSIWPT